MPDDSSGALTPFGDLFNYRPPPPPFTPSLRLPSSHPRGVGGSGRTCRGSGDAAAAQSSGADATKGGTSGCRKAAEGAGGGGAAVAVDACCVNSRLGVRNPQGIGKGGDGREGERVEGGVEKEGGEDSVMGAAGGMGGDGCGEERQGGSVGVCGKARAEGGIEVQMAALRVEGEGDRCSEAEACPTVLAEGGEGQGLEAQEVCWPSEEGPAIAEGPEGGGHGNEDDAGLTHGAGSGMGAADLGEGHPESEEEEEEDAEEEEEEDWPGWSGDGVFDEAANAYKLRSRSR